MYMLGVGLAKTNLNFYPVNMGPTSICSLGRICYLCRSRKSALTSLNSGNKNVALRHARALKLAAESREKCATLLNRVEEVLHVIANAESTKKVPFSIKYNILY